MVRGTFGEIDTGSVDFQFNCAKLRIFETRRTHF